MYYNLKRLGRTNNFNQNLQLSYKIPINKIDSSYIKINGIIRNTGLNSTILTGISGS